MLERSTEIAVGALIPVLFKIDLLKIIENVSEIDLINFKQRKVSLVISAISGLL